MAHIFTHFINRELHQSIDAKPTIDAYVNALRYHNALHTDTFYCNISQAFEFAASHPPLWQEILTLNKSDVLHFVSGYPTWDEFLDSRQKLYTFDQQRYPMYFEKARKRGFRELIIKQGQPSQSTTSAIDRSMRDILRGVRGHSNWPSEHEIRSILEIGDDLTKALDNRRGQALTYSALHHISGHSPTPRSIIRRGLSAAYIEHYLQSHDGILISGLPNLSFFDRCDEPGQPWTRFQWTSRIVKALGVDGYLSGVHRYGAYERMENTNDLTKVSLSIAVKSTLSNIHRNNDSDATRTDALVRFSNSLAQPVARSAPSDLRHCYDEALERLHKAAAQLGITAPPTIELPCSANWEITQPGRVLFMTATDTEDEVLQSLLKEKGFTKTINTRYRHAVNVWNDGKVNLFHVRTSAGSAKIGASLSVTHTMISELQPEFILSVGICFGLNRKKLSIGDVIVSEAIRCYEPQRINADSSKLGRGDKIPCGQKLLSTARSIGSELSDKIHFGLVLSGEKLVDSEAFCGELLQQEPEALGGEMEGAGVAISAQEFQRQWLLVKGVCDWGYDKTNADQVYAARNAFSFALRIFDALTAQ